MRISVRSGRTSRLKRFLSMPRYRGASRSRMRRGTITARFSRSLSSADELSSPCTPVPSFMAGASDLPEVSGGDFQPMADDWPGLHQKSFEVSGEFHCTMDRFPSAEVPVIERIREVIGVPLRNSLRTQDSSSGAPASEAPANGDGRGGHSGEGTQLTALSGIQL